MSSENAEDETYGDSDGWDDGERVGEGWRRAAMLDHHEADPRPP
jgi:hypothetical protein